MKRFLVATILTAVIAGVLTHFMPRDFENYLCSFAADATVAIYCRGTDLDAVDMGNGYKVECAPDNFSQTVAQCYSVDGLSVSFNGNYDDVARLITFFNLHETSRYEQDGLLVLCGNSTKIVGGITVDDALVNLQIAYKDGVIHVGSPLLLGDY